MEQFIKRLRERMETKGIKAAELARRSGVTKQNIGRLLNTTPHPITGALPTTTRETVEKLAKALDWDLNEALNLAGYATESAYPQTKEEFAEALKKYGVTEWKIPEKDLNKLSPEFYKSVLESMEMLVKGKLQKLEEGEQIAASDLDKVA